MPCEPRASASVPRGLTPRRRSACVLRRCCDSHHIRRDIGIDMDGLHRFARGQDLGIVDDRRQAVDRVRLRLCRQ